MKQKIMAFAFTALMMASVIPAAEATHTDGLTPDVPTLPHARPTDRCIGTSVDPSILARVNQLAAGDPAWYQTDAGVPALCLDGEPVAAYQDLIHDLDILLENLRNTSAFVQRQVDGRLEATLPDSEYPDDLVSPTTVLLSDAFDGRRTGGFGEWEVVTDAGEEALFARETVVDGNGTRTIYRFGDDEGYARGTHQWLVSPEIDLTVLKGQQLAVQDLVEARDYARSRLQFYCNDFTPNGAVPGASPLASVCGDAGDFILSGVPLPYRNLAFIVRAYEQALDDTVYQLPVMQHAAYLELAYQVNMAPGEDGVRMWIYTGDRQPDRAVLFDPDFSRGSVGETCAHQAAQPAGDPVYPPVNGSFNREGQTQHDLTCTPTLEGGRVVTSPDFRNMTPASAFQSDAPDPSNRSAFSGDTRGFVKARINLTDYFGERVWILFEAKTLRNDRGIDIFEDSGRFQRFTDYGFALGSIHAEGDGYHRNVRIKAIGGTYDYVQAINDFGDGRDVRTTLPSGNEPVVIWVHNAGDYIENVTLDVAAKRNASGSISGRYATSFEIRPDEVRSVRVPWGNLTGGAPPVERAIYHLNATLSVFERDLSGATPNEQLREPTNVTHLPATDPNTTRVRPANAASLPNLGAGSLNASQSIRVATLRNLSIIRADGTAGNPIEVCSEVDGRACTAEYAAAKGKPRVVLAGIRNDGNTPQDVRARLSVQLDGVTKDDIVAEGNERLLADILPGEIRPVEFTLVPTEPGAYKLILTLFREGETQPVDANAERRLFVQRSTGLICLDAIEERECGPAFVSEIVPALRGENVTAAALGPDGTLYVATEVREANETGRERGMLAARDTEGAWRVLRNLSGTELNRTRGSVVPDTELGWGTIRDIVVAPDASVWLVGDNMTVLRHNSTALTHVKPRAEAIDQLGIAIDLTTALWHNDTLLAAGDNGTFLHLYANGSMERFLVDWTFVNATDDLETSPYRGTVLDLAHDAVGHAIAVGEDGFVARHAPTANVSADWSDVEVNATTPIVSASVIDGRTWLVGPGILMFSKADDAAAFVNATQPAPIEGANAYVAAFQAQNGRTYVLDADSRLVACDGCTSLTPTWEYPLLARPAILDVPPAHPAWLGTVAADGARTILLGEGGALLELAVGGTYENDREWTVVPALLPHDGGVLQTRRALGSSLSEYQGSILGIPDAEGQGVVAAASEYRLFLNHSIPHEKGADGVPSAWIRLVYRNVTFRTLAGQAFCDVPPEGEDQTTGVAVVETVCFGEATRYDVASFHEATPTDGWVAAVYPNLPTAPPLANPASGQNESASVYLAAVELFVRGKAVRWAIDDLRLEGKVGDEWRTVVSWEGMGDEHRNGTWTKAGFTSLANSLGAGAGSPATNLLDGSTSEPAWEEWPMPFDLAVQSPWHVTTSYADRPIFAANNEFYLDGLSSPAAPRLFSHWDSRLVSPVIDLREAYDPTISFRHTYSFRTFIGGTPEAPTLQLGDGGLLEVQYLLSGADCGALDPAVTCGWSPFYVVEPEGSYPWRVAFGLDELPAPSRDGGPDRPYRGRIGENVSYWGRLAVPDASGLISSPRLTETYEEVRVPLADAVCTDAEREVLEDYIPGDTNFSKFVDCLPVDVTGRQIRFAFHLLTAGNYRPSLGRSVTTPYVTGGDLLNGTDMSLPGEGWFITDFKVLGAKKLGIDLAATNLTFRVGYDVGTIGVGPGTRVPINVTVENRGTFDALGYTGRLDVVKVLDRAEQTTEPVETIVLSQQPVLKTGDARNHTLFWTVPDEEGAEYAIRFVATPIGIAEDEDDSDNDVQLGTLAKPVLAQTVRRFDAKVLVSPENATSDITRYMPVYLDNTGNVPLSGFTVERRITVTGRAVANEATSCDEWRRFVLDGRPTAIVDCRVWTTARPAPAGTLAPLTAISDDVNPTVDLFWKAPERANYLVTVTASTKVGTQELFSLADKRVSAFATYLFDDVEGGPRGESDSGDWVFGPGWDAAQPGFRSTDAFTFGDPALHRYPSDANDTLVTPTIDIGTARTAQVAFYHRYAFEAGFDGGLIEASVDGVNWTPLVPVEQELVSAGYNASFPLQSTSALHPTGVPGDEAYAFTSDSAQLPSSVDGWVLSQLDLTQFADVARADVPYEAYDAGTLAGYALSPIAPVEGRPGIWRGTWCPGSLTSVGGCWEIENVTANLVPPVAPTGDEPNTFWWSGSPNIQDDERRPFQNQLLEIPVDISGWQPDQAIIVDWWEYSSRFAGSSLLQTAGPGFADPTQVLTYHTFHPGKIIAPTYRFNLSEPKIIEKDGRWMHMQADITELVRGSQGTDFRVAFTYSPLKIYAPGLSEWTEDPNRTALDAEDIEDYEQKKISTSAGPDYSAWADDLGFAIDGFTVRSVRFVNGQPVFDQEPLLDEATAWERATLSDCGRGFWREPAGEGAWPGWLAPDTAIPACFNESGSTMLRRPMVYPKGGPDMQDSIGRAWSVVDKMPDLPGGWQLREVRDHDNHTRDNLTPFGDVPHAWYTGNVGWNKDYDWDTCDTGEDCVAPGSESRLVTPVFDLGQVGGTDAKLSFWHRYAFHAYNHGSGGMPLTSGGVVEMSEYVPPADGEGEGTWTPWKQIYSEPEDMDLSPLSPFRQQEGDFRGGYSAVTTNATVTSNGVRRFDPPFENVVAAGSDGTVVQYLYSGRSTDIENRTCDADATRCDGRRDGWMRETFDVSDHIGKRVRFAFHSAFTPWASHLQVAPSAAWNGIEDTGSSDPRGGWWISDVQLVGDVLVGEPVQLRMRAGTDGNVDDGIWQVDDFGVFGSRYGSNLALVVDEADDAFGAYPSTTTTVPVTIRNLGSTMRRDLGVNVGVYTPGNGDIELGLAAPGHEVDALETGGILVRGIDLPPGQATTVQLEITTPADFGTLDLVQLVLVLEQADPVQGYLPITQNEVGGLLTSIVDFHLQAKPVLSIDGASVVQVAPDVGEPVDLKVTLRNPGYGAATTDLVCVARTVEEWNPINHDGGGLDQPRIAATYPCELVEGDLTLDAKETMALTFRATPTEAGFLQFVLSGDVLPDAGALRASAGVAVGVSPLAFTAPFDRFVDLSNWSGTSAGLSWSYLRGYTAPGSLLVGLDENASVNSQTLTYNGTCGFGTCRAVSQPVDLHNYSTESPAFLSFWHLDRLARYDGAQIRAEVLENEQRESSGWSHPCILRPVGGYEGHIRQFRGGAVPPGGGMAVPPPDTNPVFVNGTKYGATTTITPNDFFVSPGGQWEDQWQYAVFDLSQTCEKVSNSPSLEDLTLVGHKVRFVFELYPGLLPDGEIGRGRGQGIFFDDIAVGPQAISVRPDLAQRATLLDNTTKGFHVLVTNDGPNTDVVELAFDADNSSIPAGSVLVPDEGIELAAGETKQVRVDVKLPRDPSLLPTEFQARLVARSVLDPHAVGSTLLHITFAPRQWAELSVSVAAPTNVVQEGTETFIPITVENNGLVDSVATRLRIVDEWDGGRLEHFLDMQPIASMDASPEDATRVFEFLWRPEAGSVGDHTLTFEVDPDALGEEYTRSNNVAQIVVPVSDLLIPDLYVANFSALNLRNAQGGVVSAAFDADVARYEVTAGELVTFELRVANRGRAGATNVDVRPLLGALSLPPKTIPFIAPGGEAIVTFNWLAQKGEHEVEFLVRSEQVELTTENNRYPGTGVTLLTVKGYEVTVEIDAPAEVLEPGTEATVSFRITNNGNAGEDLSLRAIAPEGMRLLLPREGFFLRAGETYADDATLLLDAEAVAGEQFISIEAVARENPMKVAPGRAAVQVNATYAGSATGGLAIGAPPTLTLPIELVNEGNSLEPWTVTVQLPAGWVPAEKLPLSVVVPAHGRTVAELHVSIPETTAPGDRVVAIQAKMPNSEKRLATVRVEVQPLRAADVTVASGTPAPERGALLVPITVVNTGNVKQPFSLLLLDAPEGIELKVEPASFDLAPGGTMQAELKVTPDATVESGMYAIQGYTLFDGVVPETAEGLLNLQTLKVPIVRQDLVLAPLEYSPRAGVEAGDRVTVKVTVQNRGVGALGDLPVHLFVDDVFIEEVRIPNLPGNNRADVTFNWTAMTGVHTLTAVVDPYEDTVDADRADNAVSALASVGVDVPTGGLAAGRADTPAPGALGALLALLAALLVIRGHGSRRQRR